MLPGEPPHCPLHSAPRPLILGALGTSLTWGADLPDPKRQAWPHVLQSMLQENLGRRDIFVANGAMRASSADFSALCFDELWGSAWSDARGVGRAPRLDLAIIEFSALAYHLKASASVLEQIS